MKIATRLHARSVWHCQRDVSSTEFLEWAAAFELEQNEHTKQDHYFAQIACLIYAANKPESAPGKSIEDFLLDFVTLREDVQKARTQAGMDEITANAKAIWGARLGIVIPRD